MSSFDWKMGKVVFITGGTGMLGLNLIEQILLSKNDWQLHVLYRNATLLEHINQIISRIGLRGNTVSFIHGDINDYNAMLHTVPDGVDYVFHMAAVTSQWSGDDNLLVKVNVDGTNNIIRLCLEKKFKKLIYTSSIAAYAPPHGSVISENSPKLGESHISFYNKTKHRSELAVLKAVRDQGLQAVILNPCQVLGKYDSASWAQFFSAICDKQLKVIGKGGGSFCYATEVAKAHIAAAERGRVGENYLLGGTSMSFAVLAAEIARLHRIDFTPKVVPDFVLKSVANSLDWYSYYWSQAKPLITPSVVERLIRAYTVDSSKAHNELGYDDKYPVAQSILEEYLWITEKKV